MKRKHVEAVLTILESHPRITGRELRQHLNTGKRWWEVWRLAPFYTLLVEMEDALMIYTSQGVDNNAYPYGEVPMGSSVRLYSKNPHYQPEKGKETKR